MGLKTKILLTLGFATGLTLLTLFIFFRQEFITYTLWVIGITFVLFVLVASGKSEDNPEFEAYPVLERVGYIFGHPIYTVIWHIFRRK